MAEWFSIEVLNGASSARQWSDGAIDVLVNDAIVSGASEWSLHQFPWGCVVEFEFADEAMFERFRTLPSTAAALERVPDPVNGLLVHRGRGGSSGTRFPRHPIPLRGSGAAALPLPEEPEEDAPELLHTELLGASRQEAPLSVCA